MAVELPALRDFPAGTGGDPSRGGRAGPDAGSGLAARVPDSCPAKGNGPLMGTVSAQTAAFNRGVLSQLGAPPSGYSLAVLDTMALQESPGYLTTVNNPLATTRGGAGAYNLPGSVFASGRNSAGVKGYGTTAEGQAATAATLKQSNFAALLKLLRGNAPQSAYTTGAAAAELRSWQGGSSADVIALGGKAPKVSGQSSGGSTAQGGGAPSAQAGPNPAGWLGTAASVPADVAGWLGGLVGTAGGAAAGAVAGGVVSGASGAALGSAEGFYAAAKPYVVPIGVAFFVAILLTPILTGKGSKSSNPVSVTIDQLGEAAGQITGSGGSGQDDDDDQAADNAPPAPAPPPAPAEAPMTPAQVIQSEVASGVRNNQAIMREINRRRAAGTLIEDGAEAAAA